MRSARTIGLATLYRGDCVELLTQLPPDSVDMIWTDPPYGNENHAGDFNARLNEKRALESKPILNDDLESMQRVVQGMLRQSARVVRPTGAVLACCGGGGPTPVFAWLAQNMNCGSLKFFHAVVWDKKNPGLGWRYRRRYEFVMVAHRADGKLLWANENIAVSNIVELMPPRDRAHPNEKPVILIEQFIDWHTKPGDTICDPFMGSGSTGVAAVKTGRKFIGMELDQEHFDMACRRIEEAQKQEGLFA